MPAFFTASPKGLSPCGNFTGCGSQVPVSLGNSPYQCCGFMSNQNTSMPRDPGVGRQSMLGFSYDPSGAAGPVKDPAMGAKSAWLSRCML